jgi:aromatic ring-opening dioxygenase catalytic subunit (LigB family)
VAFTKRFPNDVLLSHAHWQILARMMPEADIPIVLLFVNAIHVPAVNPNRCYRLGETLRKLVTEQSAVKRVAIYGSGGLSHFTSGYPWSHYKGTFSVGSISEDFDRHAVQLLSGGEGEKLASFTSQDLLDNGEIELRSWLVVAGVVGAVRPQLLVYEPFYSGVMGMGVGYWEL